MWAIVPYKGVPSGKSRLAKHLNVEQRAALASAMLCDVLVALVESQGLAGIIVSTASSEADIHVTDSRVAVYRDNADSLAQAIAEASEHAIEQFEARSTFVIPADIPLITSRDVDFAIENHRQVTIIPDSEDIGTNGLLCTPPNAFKYIFDGKSFHPHLEASREAGLNPEVMRLATFGHDIDTIGDLVKVADAIPNSATARTIRQHHLLRNKQSQD